VVGIHYLQLLVDLHEEEEDGMDDDEVMLHDEVQHGYLHWQIIMQVILQVHTLDEVGYCEVNII
jgi:hypothetical protein